jgi:hypothetical protein
VCCLILLHGCNLAVQLSPPRVDLSEPFVTLFGDLGEPLGTLRGDLHKTLGVLLLRLFQHTTDLGQHTLHRRLQQGPHLAPHRRECLLGGLHRGLMTTVTPQRIEKESKA